MKFFYTKALLTLLQTANNSYSHGDDRILIEFYMTEMFNILEVNNIFLIELSDFKSFPRKISWKPKVAAVLKILVVTR